MVDPCAAKVLPTIMNSNAHVTCYQLHTLLHAYNTVIAPIRLLKSSRRVTPTPPPDPLGGAHGPQGVCGGGGCLRPFEFFQHGVPNFIKCPPPD